MKKSIRTICFLMFACMAMPAAQALEIPLDGTKTISGGPGAVNVGYVDIEKIFAEHPMTARVQNEFKAEIEKRKAEIAEMEAAVADLQNMIVSSATQVSQSKTELEAVKRGGLTTQTTTQAQPGDLSSSTAAAVSLQPETAVVMNTLFIAAREKDIKEKEAGIEAMKQDVAKKKEEIRVRVKQNKEDLKALEEKKTTLVLNDLYKILEKLAVEENMTIIVDKNYVLYGQPGQDLTQKVRERLQGR